MVKRYTQRIQNSIFAGSTPVKSILKEMIQMQTQLKTADNSGAKTTQCIKTLLGFNRKIAFCGDFILISIKKLRLIRKVKVGEIHLGVIIRTRKETSFLDGSFSKFNSNSLIALNKKKRVLGTRLFGWLSRNLRKKKFLRILILCGYCLI